MGADCATARSGRQSDAPSFLTGHAQGCKGGVDSESQQHAAVTVNADGRSGSVHVTLLNEPNGATSVGADGVWGRK